MSRCRHRTVVALICAAVTLAGCSGSDRIASPKLVDIEMTEMRFRPSHLRFEVGAVVTFRFHNKGTERHEAVIGDQEAQDAARAAMAGMRGRSRATPRHPGMDIENMVSVEPGETAELSLQFTKPATLLMQCHEDGHLESGMTGTIEIVP